MGASAVEMSKGFLHPQPACRSREAREHRSGFEDRGPRAPTSFNYELRICPKSQMNQHLVVKISSQSYERIACSAPSCLSRFQIYTSCVIMI